VIGRTIEALAPGETAQIAREVERDDVTHFVDAVGDYNPVHSDPAYAATTLFKEPIAPGIFTAGLISAVIGTQLPGPGAIYLSQSLKFLKPVMLGDTITATVAVAEIVRDRNRVRLSTTCTNQHGDEVLSGEAWVMPSRTPIVYDGARRAPWAWPDLACQPWAWAAQALAFWATLGLSLMGSGGAPAATSGARR
jgi:acyl dehydratase